MDEAGSSETGNGPLGSDESFQGTQVVVIKVPADDQDIGIADIRTSAWQPHSVRSLNNEPLVSHVRPCVCRTQPRSVAGSSPDRSPVRRLRAVDVREGNGH